MADLKERVDGIIDHHSSEGAKAGAVMQEWTARMAYDVGQEILKEEKYKDFRELEPRGGSSRLLDFSAIQKLSNEDRKAISLVSLSKELNIQV